MSLKKALEGLLQPFAILLGVIGICAGFYFFKPAPKVYYQPGSEVNSVSHSNKGVNDLSAEQTAILHASSLYSTTKRTDLGNGNVQVDIEYSGSQKCTLKLKPTTTQLTTAYVVYESTCNKS
ncbi:TPA: hypothetical protein MW242_002896 [Acinetobacter baumannii]|nr:hypothetical protein [Acinetobacter baumannii]